MIRWRELLTHLNVAWVDRGPSVTRGEIAVRCPWCGNADPSQHLGINETTGYYNCWRISGHGGKSAYYLLRALGARGDLDDLIETYGGAPRRREERVVIATTPYAKRWASFKPAATDSEACDYLAGRGFWNPQRTARAFDLRVGQGRYGGRLWFPFYYGSDIVGYTGRAMRRAHLRYYTEAASSYLYLPRPLYDTDRLIILVEGPVDALRLADAALERYHLTTAAFCGLSVTPDKLLQLAALARAVPRLYIVLDSTVEPVSVNRLMTNFKALPFARTQVERLDLPPGVDDPGELTGEQIEIWLRQTGMAKLASA